MSLYLGENLISGVATPVEGARNVGQIIQSTIPLTDAGLHLLDGALISGSGSYADFVTYISNLDLSAGYFCTEAEWQTSVSNYGVCGKFVYDSVNNTVRLPKITGIVEGTTDLTVLGDLVEAGLPNINFTLNPGSNTQGNGFGATSTVTGCANLTGSSSTQYVMQSTSAKYTGYTLSVDASNSSSIYGNSSTVQPQTIKVLYYIVIATSTKTDIQVDIDNIATDLNGKADVDLSNCTKPHIVETYINGSSWYRKYSDGFIKQGGLVASSSSNRSEVQVVFPVSFTTTSYSFSGHSDYPSALSSTTQNTVGNTARSYSVVTDRKSTSGVYITYINADWTIEWTASGY